MEDQGHRFLVADFKAATPPKKMDKKVVPPATGLELIGFEGPLHHGRSGLNPRTLHPSTMGGYPPTLFAWKLTGKSWFEPLPF